MAIVHKSTFPGIPPSASKKYFLDWLTILKRRESGIIVFPYKGGGYRHIEDFLTQTDLLTNFFHKHPPSYSLSAISALQYLPFTSDKIIDLIKQRLSELQGEYKAILLYDTDDWFGSSRSDILTQLAQICENDHKISFILFCETNFSHPKFIKQTLASITLAQNVFIYPLHSNQDLIYNIKQVARSYGCRIGSNQVHDLLTKVGRHTWLLKESVRIFDREKRLPQNYLHYPTIRIKLEALWQRLSPEEQTILKQIAKDPEVRSQPHSYELEYLQVIQFITTENNQYQFSIPLLKDYILEKVSSRTLSYGNQHFYVDEVPIISHFNRQEELLLETMLSQPGTIVSRESLGAKIWLDSVEYSDANLDKIISRTRKKLSQIEISPDKIRVVKGRGVVWQG